MQNRYLEILELHPGASKTDIKAAYRRLSKKYHPDVSKDANAKERFIEVNEAYKFLTQVGPYPQQQQVAYDYNPQAEEYDRWRKQAREYARWKAREAERRQTEMLKNILFGFNSVAWVMLIFNFLLALDFFIPPTEIEQTINRIKPVYESSRYRGNHSYSYDDVYLSDYRMRFGARTFKYDQPTGVIFVTTLFDKPMSFKASVNGRATTYKQIYNVYHVFGFIIPLIFCALFLYRFVLKSLDPQLTLALFLVFIFIFQVYMFFKF